MFESISDATPFIQVSIDGIHPPALELGLLPCYQLPLLRLLLLPLVLVLFLLLLLHTQLLLLYTSTTIHPLLLVLTLLLLKSSTTTHTAPAPAAAPAAPIPAPASHGLPRLILKGRFFESRGLLYSYTMKAIVVYEYMNLKIFQVSRSG